MKNTVILAIVAVVLSSCSIYGKYQRSTENIPVDDLYRAELIENPQDTTSLGSMPWEEMFTDRYLQELIRTGLENNANLQTAVLRVEQAKAGLYAAKWSYSPTLAVSPQGGITSIDGGKASYSYNLGGAASWDFDLFGSILNAKRGAQALLLQQEAYKQAVRSQIIAAIANSYYALLMMDKQVEISEQSVDIWKEQVRTMEAMLRVGSVNENALTQARANLYGLEASHANLVKQQKETENALCSLLGQPSGSIERGKIEEQTLPEKISAGIPLQLLSNRPDVYAAEMALASAFYNTNAARSAFYPKLTLTGSAGWTNSVGQAIANPAGVLINAIGNLTEPIFNRGKLKANLESTRAAQEIAKINYKQSLLDAGKEVNDALFAIQTSGVMLENHIAQCKDLKRTVDISTLLWEKAGGSYLEMLSAQQYFLNAQLGAIADKFNQLKSTVSLYQSLGGGKEDPAVQVNPDDKKAVKMSKELARAEKQVNKKQE